MNTSLTDEEPDLSTPIADGYKSTWGDKKRLCQCEAQSAYEQGLGAEANPYIRGTPSYRWWNQYFLELFDSDAIQ